MKKIRTPIETLHMADLKNKVHSSIFDENEFYNMLIIRIPLLSKDILDIKQLGFIIDGEDSYVYNEDENELNFLDSHFTKLHKMIDRPVDALLKRFTLYQDQVSDIEDNLYEQHKNQNFLNHWLRLKRDILHIERVLLRSVTVIEAFTDYYKEQASFPLNHYEDLHEHMHRILRSSSHQLSKLDYIYNFYTVQTNEKMNRMIYLLTVISGVFLPLNLAVGFFGMNTSGLPFTAGQTGTWGALTLMVGFLIISIGSFVFLKKKPFK